MANAKTEHSRRLRRATADAFQSRLTAAKRFEVKHKDPAVIAAIRAGIDLVEGSNQAEKILFLLECYQKNSG